MSTFFSNRGNVEISKTGNLYFIVNALLGAYNRRTDAWKALQQPIAGGGNNGDIIGAIDRLSVEIGTVRAQQELILELLENIDQSKVDEITSRVKAVREKLKTSVDNQPKGDQI